MEEVEGIEKSLMNIKKEVGKKKKIIDNILLDILGETEVKMVDLKQNIGLSIDE